MTFTDDGQSGVEAITASRRRLVPMMDLLHDTVLRLLPEPRAGEPYRVLDIGTGTGLLVSRLLKQHPNAKVHVIHAEPANLEAARQRLAEHGDNLSFELSDYGRLNLEGPFDVAITELAANFLENKSKRTLLSATYAALRRGGRVINIVQTRGMTEAVETMLATQWEAMARDLGANDFEIGNSIITSAKDRTATLAQQLEWMGGDGFENVDCIVKVWRFAVVTGEKV